MQNLSIIASVIALAAGVFLMVHGFLLRGEQARIERKFPPAE